MDFVGLVERELGLRPPVVFVFPAWGGREFVRVIDEETGGRYYGMSGQLWYEVKGVRMSKYGGPFEQVKVHFLGPHEQEIRIPVSAPAATVVSEKDPSATIDFREIVIRRSR